MSWSHYRLLIRVEDERKRLFYMREAVDQRWTVRQLDREIHSFYYERLLATREGGRESVRQEVKQLEPATEADGLLKDLLCATKDATVAKYSALADKKGLFTSRYTLCLPTEEELARALEPTSVLFLE